MPIEAPPDFPLVPNLQGEVDEFRRKACLALLPGVCLTSWWRDPVTNERVGGLDHSQHLWGGALDLVGPVGTLEEIAQRALLAGLTPVMELDHLHLQAFPENPFTNEALTVFQRLPGPL